MARPVTAEDAHAAGSGLAQPCGHRLPAACVALALAALPAGAGAQDAAVFTPTYAASTGSPYSEVYARTFGTTGRADAGASRAEPPPLETAAPAPDAVAGRPAPEVVPGVVPQVIYVIEGSRLLTYRAEDYPHGGTAIDQAPLPPAETAYIGGAPDVQVPPIAGRLYGGLPADIPASTPAALPANSSAGPIPLVPPPD